MERIHIIIPRDLKLKYQIKALEENKSMTEILIEFIKSYVGRQTKRTA